MAVKMPLREVAVLIKGSLRGDPDLEITGAATIRDARPGDITLADNARLKPQLAGCSATAVVVPHDFLPAGIAAVAVNDVHAAFAQIVAYFRPPRRRPRIGVSPAAHVHPSTRIGREVDIYPGAYIEVDVEIGDGSTIHSGVRILAGCKIGRDVTIFPNAVLYEDTIVGDRCIIHAGAVIGAYGFGYLTEHGRHRLSAQLGHVEMESDVEIGACTTIDRGTYGPTAIGAGTKIDNLVQIAHNCRIGRHNLLCSHVGIAGSCTTGDYVVMAGQAGSRDHINIGDRVTVGAQAGIMHDIDDGETQVGSPATPVRQQMVMQAALSRLPEMRKELKALQHQVERLERRVESLFDEPDSNSKREAA